ncbi:hypothetical protein VTN77DRAFT_9117 [Rasamsonia byssochlamydoides]|uniref:uncharacterized protein n=1 Tax=Rasamsonia byssochlamydoides TaxID=89139 RepID=UPI003743ACE6
MRCAFYFNRIPIQGTINKSSAERAKQAITTVGQHAEMEITALGQLTKAGCSCTPTLFAWKQEKQESHMWIPGGFLVYILMEKLPGIRLDNVWSLDREERDEVRKSFKEAWEECRACGVINMDRSCRNLLWDRAAKKCYILDFEQWVRAKARHKWDDGEYPSWDLAYWRCGDERGAMDL